LSTTRLATRSGLFNQSPYLILDWIHHWLRKKPPSTLERTISSRSTTTGNQYLYDGRELFGRFRETTDEIAPPTVETPRGSLLLESDSTAVPTADEAS